MEMLKIHHQTQHEIEVRHDPLLGLEPELLILHEMVSEQDRSLHLSGFPTWLVQLCCLAIFHPIHKLEILCVMILIVMSIVVPSNLSMGVIPSSPTLS